MLFYGVHEEEEESLRGAAEQLWELEQTVFAGLEYASLYADEFLNLYFGYKARMRHPPSAASLLFKEAEKEVLTGGEGPLSKLKEFCSGEDADAEHFEEWLRRERGICAF